MKVTLKTLLEEIKFQEGLVRKAEDRVHENPIRIGINNEETQFQNNYPTEECARNYFAHLQRLEELKRIKVQNSLKQMLLIKQQENMKSMIAFYRKVRLPDKVFTTTKFDENKNPIVEKHVQYFPDGWNRKAFDIRIDTLESEIQVIQQQINQLNAETFVEIPERV